MKTTKIASAALCMAALTTATAQDAGSTFGHARTRALAALGKLPAPHDVVVADLVNFHRHRLPLPRAGEAVALDLRLGSATVDARGEAVLQIGYTGAAAADRRDMPPINLGLAIDCSGSMGAAGKLDAVKRALRVLATKLRPEDRVTLVRWSETADVMCSGRVDSGRLLLGAIDRLEPGGATNLHAGLTTTLAEVARHRSAGGHSRVILLTDGIANRGQTEAARILDDARGFTSEGIDLATIGFGTDLNTELLDRLARGARGLFHFVADAEDVEKVFVKEIQAQLAAVGRSLRLRIFLPEDVSLGQVFGHDARRGEEPGEYVIDLPDVNAGATQVVLATVRVRHSREPETQIEARLDYRTVGGTLRTLEARAEVTTRSDSSRTPRLTDAEVRKNYTIARVADGLHRMARAARAERWVDADRELQDALAAADRHFPSREDEDVRRVTDMAEKFRKTLRAYIDCFRDG